MRTCGSVAPESSRSGSGKSTYCVCATPTEPGAPTTTGASRTDMLRIIGATPDSGGCSLQVQRLEQLRTQCREREVTALAWPAQADVLGALDRGRPLAKQDDPVG